MDATATTLIRAIATRFETMCEATSSGDSFAFFDAHHGVIDAGLQLHVMLRGDPGLHPWGAGPPPHHVINRSMSEGELQYFIENMLAPGAKRDAASLQERLFEWASYLIEEAASGIEGIDAARVIGDMEKAMERTTLRNFRHVVGVSGVYRSTMPGVHAGKKVLDAWLQANDVRTIIDLRRPEEVVANPNDPIVGIHPGIKNVHVNFNSTPDATTPPVHDYVRGLITRKAEIDRAFKEMLDSPGSTLIHCVAGKDRTGIISALVQLLAGVPEETIIDDYVLSGHEAIPSRIKLTLDHVRKEGGIAAFLTSCGFSPEQQAALARKISPVATR